MTSSRDEIQDQSINKIDLMNRTFAYLTSLYGAKITIRELLSIPLPKLTADIGTKYAFPIVIIADINAGLAPLSLRLGEQRQPRLPTLAYPGLSRRESARLFLWFFRYGDIRTDAWALKDLTRTLASFEAETVSERDVPMLLIRIEGQQWKRLDGVEAQLRMWPTTTYGDVLAAYFLPD